MTQPIEARRRRRTDESTRNLALVAVIGIDMGIDIRSTGGDGLEMEGLPAAESRPRLDCRDARFRASQSGPGPQNCCSKSGHSASMPGSSSSVRPCAPPQPWGSFEGSLNGVAGGSTQSMRS